MQLRPSLVVGLDPLPIRLHQPGGGGGTRQISCVYITNGGFFEMKCLHFALRGSAAYEQHDQCCHDDVHDLHEIPHRGAFFYLHSIRASHSICEAGMLRLDSRVPLLGNGHFPTNYFFSIPSAGLGARSFLNVMPSFMTKTTFSIALM